MGTEKNSGRGTEGSEINSEDYESATTFSPNVFLTLNFIKLRTFCSQKGGGGVLLTRILKKKIYFQNVENLKTNQSMI